MIRRRGNPDRLLATVVFTDIVGSTELAGQLGDRAWKALIARHNAIVRRELKRFAGRELDTAGDGFFVMFERPAQAIDCAWAVIDALRPLNLQIRAAVHMGEVEVMGGKVGGIAVHAASRVLAMAQPGQIYVTGIVRDVVAGSDITFSDQGTHELRGLPGEWRLYAVDQTATDRALPVEPPAEPIAVRRNWPLILAGVGIVAVVAAVGTALALAGLSRPAPIVPRPNTVVRINPSNNGLVASVDLQDPTEMAADGSNVWVLSLGGRTVSRVDSATGSVASVGLPAAPTGIAAGEGAVWITTGFGSATGRGGVQRVGTTSRQLEGTIELGDGVAGVVVGEGALWVTNRIQNSLVRIDLNTRAISGQVTTGEQPEAVALGEGSVYVANVIGRTIWRIDPAAMTHIEITLVDAPDDIAFGHGRLWVTSTAANSVTLIDTSSNTIQRTLTMPGSPRGVAAGTEYVWVALSSGQVAKIDPADPEAFETIALAGAPEDVAVADGSVWVSIRE